MHIQSKKNQEKKNIRIPTMTLSKKKMTIRLVANASCPSLTKIPFR